MAPAVQQHPEARTTKEMDFMATTSLPDSRTEPTTEPQPAYVLRGLGLYELHGDAILQSYQGGGRYLVPSGTEAAKVYEVRVGSRPERARCECVGFQHHKHCSHIVAAQRVHSQSAVCGGCGRRTWRRELVEVHEEHESLTCYPGDRLCRVECAGDHGVL
jgi:hypothetical protein